MPNIQDNFFFIGYLHVFHSLEQEVEKLLRHNELMSCESNEAEANEIKMEITQMRQAMFNQYVFAILECVTELEQTTGEEKESYLNWIRWNRELIQNNIFTFLSDPDLIAQEACDSQESFSIRNSLVELLTTLDQLSNTFFSFNPGEKDIITEYEHCLKNVKKRHAEKRISPAFAINSVERIVSYLSLLYKRRVTDPKHCGRRRDFDFEDLKDERNLIIEFLVTAREKTKRDLGKEKDSLRKQNLKDRLQVFSDVEANLNNTWEQYENFLNNDQKRFKAQVRIIADRIEDRSIQQAARILYDAANQAKIVIREIRRWLRESLDKAFDSPKTIVTAAKDIISNPVTALKNIYHILSHPVNSCKSLYAYARKHPVRIGTLFIGGMAVGLIGGSAMATAIIAAPFLAPATAVGSITAIAFGLGGGAIGAAGGVAASGVLISDEVASGTKLITDAEGDESIHEGVIDLAREEIVSSAKVLKDNVIAEIEKRGEIKRQLDLDADQVEEVNEKNEQTEEFLRRSGYFKTKEKLDENAKRYAEKNRECKEKMWKNIKSRGREENENALKGSKESVAGIEAEQEKLKEEKKEKQESIREAQERYLFFKMPPPVQPISVNAELFEEDEMAEVTVDQFVKM